MVVLLAASAYAQRGGVEEVVWTFDVIEVEEVTPEAHILTLAPSPPGTRFPRTCERFIVHARHRPEETLAGYQLLLFSASAYAKAIRSLRDSKVLGKLARFGSLDKGFGEIDAKTPCEVASRGLAIHLGHDGVPSVYSVY